MIGQKGTTTVPMLDPSKINRLLSSPAAAQTADPMTALAVAEPDMQRAPGKFASIYKRPAFLDTFVPGIAQKMEQTVARQKLLTSGVQPQHAEALIATANRNNWTMDELFQRITAVPQLFGDVMQGVPNAPNPDATLTWQWTGPNGATPVPAGATVTVSWQPAKSFNARSLVIVAGANLTTDQDDLVLSSVLIGNVTQNNSGAVPSTIYRPSSNIVPGVPNFSGPWVPQNTTIQLTLTNTGADALSVTVAMGGPTVG